MSCSKFSLDFIKNLNTAPVRLGVEFEGISHLSKPPLNLFPSFSAIFNMLAVFNIIVKSVASNKQTEAVVSFVFCRFFCL